MAELIWKEISQTYNGREIRAEYARDGDYVRVKTSRSEDRIKHNKKATEAMARLLLGRMAADGKV